MLAASGDREANRIGEIVYTMPDGAFCRHLAFDNATGEVTERTVEQCDQNIGKRKAPQDGLYVGQTLSVAISSTAIRT